LEALLLALAAVFFAPDVLFLAVPAFLAVVDFFAVPAFFAAPVFFAELDFFAVPPFFPADFLALEDLFDELRLELEPPEDISSPPPVLSFASFISFSAIMFFLLASENFGAKKSRLACVADEDHVDKVPEVPRER
jgi:hypothetical protein